MSLLKFAASMRKLFVISLFLLTIVILKAQPALQVIRGTVLDAASKEPLIGASVIVSSVNGQPGAISDDNGNFRIPAIPVGRHQIKVSYVGYSLVILTNIVVNSGKEVVLNIEMTEQVLDVKEIIVTANKQRGKANNEMAAISNRNFTIEETNRYAGALGDPSRMASNFAGVATANDQRNDIIIRGNSPLGLLWRLEGADIPNPNHFTTQGSNGGPVSILNNNTLSNSDFFTGAFPAEFGNAYAGVFDLKLRRGNNEKHEYTAQVGFNGAELMAEGPFNQHKKASYLVSYRYSSLAVFQRLGLNFGTSGIPRYQDGCLKINLPTSKAGQFSMFGIGGISYIELLDSKRKANDNSFGLREKQDVRFGTRMYVAGLSHLLQLGKGAYLRTVLSSSSEARTIDSDTLDINNKPFRTYAENSKQLKHSLHVLFTRKINSRHTIRAGAIASSIVTDITDSNWNRSAQRYIHLRDIQKSTGLMQTYVQHKFQISNQFNLTGGLHSLLFLLNNSFAIEPRAAFQYMPRPGRSWAFGYGMHNQTQVPLFYYINVTHSDGTITQPNKSLGLTRSQHLVAGYDHYFSPSFHAKSEVYYQWLQKIPVDARAKNSFSVINYGTDFTGFPLVDSAINRGTAHNKGIEITVEKFFDKGYYFLITGSFFDSKYKGSDEVVRSTSFNNQFVLNALGGWEYYIGSKKENLIIADIKTTVAGGRPYIPLDLVRSANAGRAIYDFEKAYSVRFSDYFRTDLKLSYRHNGKKSTLEMAVNISNLFNSQNILLQNYSASRQQVVNEYQLSRLIVPQIKLVF